MATTFSVTIDDKQYEIAFRSGIGDGKVGISWKEPLAKYLDPNTPVFPLDNTAQGVETIGDLIFLEKHGKFDV